MAKTPSESSCTPGLKIPVVPPSEQRVRSERPENKPHALTPVTGVLSDCAELPSNDSPDSDPGPVAQSVEQATENCRVGGSTPSRATAKPERRPNGDGPPSLEWFKAQTRPEPSALAWGDCWVWTRSIVDGYARLSIGGKECLAHRVTYELSRGAVPTWLTLDHLCRNRACINPAHLEPISQAENTRRGMSPSAVAGRTGLCPLGHQLSPVGGRARCKVCHAKRQREWYERKCAAEGKTPRARRAS